MREKFQTELLELNNNLVMMGALCESAISMAIKGFLTGEPEHAVKAAELETEIDTKEKEIEQRCLKLLLKQQPVATDLRVISAALKMITDLERIGDQALDIAELSKYTKSVIASDNIKKMAEEAVGMVTNSIDSYVNKDLALANAVIAHDDVIDELFDAVKNDIIEEIKTGSKDPQASIDIVMISKYLERIADHATNIAEWVVFSITGKHEEE